MSVFLKVVPDGEDLPKPQQERPEHVDVDEVREAITALLGLQFENKYGDMLSPEMIHRVTREYIFDEDGPPTRPIRANEIVNVAGQLDYHFAEVLAHPELAWNYGLSRRSQAASEDVGGHTS
jgi:hypothetical protein